MTKAQRKKITVRAIIALLAGLVFTAFTRVIPQYKALKAENMQRGGGTSDKILLSMTFRQSKFTPFVQTRLFSYIKVLLIFSIILFIGLTILTRFTRRK